MPAPRGRSSYGAQCLSRQDIIEGAERPQLAIAALGGKMALHATRFMRAAKSCRSTVISKRRGIPRMACPIADLNRPLALEQTDVQLHY